MKARIRCPRVIGPAEIYQLHRTYFPGLSYVVSTEIVIHEPRDEYTFHSVIILQEATTEQALEIESMVNLLWA
jgi:hypothetical protein